MSDKTKKETIIEKIKEHWLFGVIVIIAISAGTAWNIANELSEQQKKIIENQKVEISDLNDKVEKLNKIIDDLKNKSCLLPNLTVNISSPKNGDRVPYPAMVSGFYSGKWSDGQVMWLVTSGEYSPGEWVPQAGRIDFVEEHEVPWQGEVWLGEKGDIGKKFKIAVVLVNEAGDEIFREMRSNASKGYYSSRPLPDGTTIKREITVIRQ